MANIINDLKKLQGVIMDNEGNYLPKLTGVYKNVKLSERRFEFLKGLMHLVLTTKLQVKHEELH